jgi:hypothetical protein
MAKSSSVPDATEIVPDGFRVDRAIGVGRHPLLEAFPGLDQLPAARRLVRDKTGRTKLFGSTAVEIVDQDLWMYVAPKEMPKTFRRRWKPVVSANADCIVIGASHIRESPELMLFMDIFHELCHVIQRQGGAELWPPGLTYVERWTEIEGYRFVVDEARRIGVGDAYLREYLRVDWISEEEHRTLLGALGVSPDD